jgi:hypothetical protein
MAVLFTSPIPSKFLDDPETTEYFRALELFINDLVAPDGVIATGEETTAVVLTQQEKLDLMTITQDVNLDTVESDTASNKAKIDPIATGSPTYLITNDSTSRVLNANAAAGAISATYVQAEIENLRDAILSLSDVEATHIRDGATKGIFGG